MKGALRPPPAFEDARPAVVLVGAVLAQHVTTAPREWRDVRLVRTLDELPQVIAACIAPVCVLPTTPTLGIGALELLGRLRRASPAARTVIFLPAGASGSREVPSLIQLGATDLIVGGTDMFWARIREIVRESEDHPNGARIASAVSAFVPAELYELCLWSALNARRPITVEEMARRAGVSRSTLRRRLVSTLGLAPSEWLRWLRLLYVLEMRSHSQTLDSIAGILDFSAGTHVRRLVHRFEQRYPTQMGEPLTLASAFGHLKEIVEEKRSLLGA